MFGWTEAEEETFHHKLSMGMLWISPITFLFLYFVTPPNWGKTYKTLLGPTVPPRIGWCLFEIPNLYWSVICFFARSEPLPIANTLLLGLFVGHYINRSIVYPLTLNAQSKPLPLEIVLSAQLYTNVNGYVQAQGLCQFTSYPEDYIYSPSFWFGVLIFGIGVAINWQSDDILRNLRKGKDKKKSDDDNKTGTKNSSSNYVIPYGGFFAYVSNPHYFGEIVEWTGFALACQNLPAWSFVAFTCSNLIPRAVAHHKWYLDHFPDYPPHRKAVIPFVW